MTKLAFKLSLTTMAIALGISGAASACTDFKVTAQDGTVLITRSLEFAQDMHSNLISTPRGQAFSTTAPDGQPAMTWTSKYGYLFLDGFNMDRPVDGMNEQGLSFEALYMPGFAQYQTVPAGMDAHALPYANFGDWVLGNFKTVDQVRAALTHMVVFAQKVPATGDMIFPLHFSIYDASGKGIVVEYVKGKLHIYDNIGVFTNSPPYDWQTTNLANYINLRPTNPTAVVANGVSYAANGQGFGLLGLPGDYTPPSRFVKTAVLTTLALPASNATGALNLAEHIINNVDIPRGVVREGQTGTVVNDQTQWVDFKDLTHKVFYYRTYDNMTLRSVSLAKINFAPNAPRFKMPLENGAYSQDVTSQFLSTTN